MYGIHTGRRGHLSFQIFSKQFLYSRRLFDCTGRYAAAVITRRQGRYLPRLSLFKFLLRAAYATPCKNTMFYVTWFDWPLGYASRFYYL